MVKEVNGVTTVLSKNDDPTKTKTFFRACDPTDGAVASLTKHMESLTEENCDGFFPAPRVKKEKKPKAADQPAA